MGQEAQRGAARVAVVRMGGVQSTCIENDQITRQHGQRKLLGMDAERWVVMVLHAAEILSGTLG